MTRLKLLPRLLAIVLITGVISCKTEGPEGPAGRDGLDGNANVKTRIITVTPSGWSGDGYVYQAQKQADIITADIVEKGAVLCYLQDANNTYIPLPYTFTNWYPDEQD